MPLEARTQTGNLINGVFAAAVGGVATDPITVMASAVGDLAILAAPPDAAAPPVAGFEPVSLFPASAIVVPGPADPTPAADGTTVPAALAAAHGSAAYDQAASPLDLPEPEIPHGVVLSLSPFHGVLDGLETPASGTIEPPVAGQPPAATGTLPYVGGDDELPVQSVRYRAPAAGFAPGGDGSPAGGDGTPAGGSSGGNGMPSGGSPGGDGSDDVDPPPIPVVAVFAPDPTASEAAVSTGLFQFSRTGPREEALTVTYTVSGDGDDQGRLRGTVRHGHVRGR